MEMQEGCVAKFTFVLATLFSALLCGCAAGPSFNSNERRTVASAETVDPKIACWRSAKRLDNFSAAILCSSANPTLAIQCWKPARGVDNDSAALLCASSHPDQAIKCWREAKGVDNLSAAILCSEGVHIAAVVKMKREPLAAEDSNLVTARQETGLAPEKTGADERI